MTSRRGWVFAAIVVFVVAADQLTKHLVRSGMDLYQQFAVIDGFLWFTRVHNTGAAFGILRGQQWLLIGTAVVMLLGVSYIMARMAPRSTWARVALALVMGGAIGNLIDRIALGGVTDFFDLGWFPVFNVADIALDVGVAVLVAVLLFGGRQEAGHDHALDTQPDVRGGSCTAPDACADRGSDGAPDGEDTAREVPDVRAADA